MTDQVIAEESADRIVIQMDPGGPVDLTDLTGSFSALARMYERHHRPGGHDDPAPKLYITRLRSGSIIAEIVPYVMILGQIVPAMDTALIVAEFTRRLSQVIKAFSDPHGLTEARPSRSDAEDIKAFVRPLTGRRGANLGIRHARFERREGEAHTVAEYAFDENELNRATVKIDQALTEIHSLENRAATPEGQKAFNSEVMLFFEQASRRPGKEKGRTGDRGIVPDVSPKALPVYFKKSVQDLKDQMVKGEANPLTNTAFVVDVMVQWLDGEPKAYNVTHVYEAIQIGDDDR